MAARLFAVLVLLAGLVFTLTWAASAQGPEPGRPPELHGQVGPALSGNQDMLSGDVLTVLLGQPGTSFRYVQRFGVTEAGHIEDTNHFYGVDGVTIDGTDIWVTDSWGGRVLKFDANGNFLQQIGKASFQEATGTSLDYITDVVVDSGGAIWVVDSGAAHVVKFNSSGQRVSELGQAWNRGTGNDRFNDPISIAFDGAGNVYVSDSGLWGDYGNYRVQVFDSSGAYLATIGVTGVPGSDNAHFRQPRHIAISGNELYVADAGNHRVQSFDITTPAAPVYVATLGVSGVSGSDNVHFDYPEGVGVDANYIYVADSNNNRVQIFNRTSLAYVTTIGTGASGTGNYEFNHPTDVVVGSAGRIYVADNYNKRVQQYDSSRNYLRTYGTTGVSYVTDGYHYNYPSGVAVAADGSIYVIEEHGHRLVKLSATGEPQWTIGEPGQNGTDNDHFFGPNGVAVDSAGRVYVADSWANHRVQIFNSDSGYYATLGAGYGSGNYQFDNPYGVAVDSADNTYVADRNNHRVQVYDASRTYIGTIGVTGVPGSDNAHFNEPHDVAVDRAGNVYVADLNNHRVQKCIRNGSSWSCAPIVGETGVSGSDFGHLSNPIGIAVDAAGRVYVADGWGWRVQVFDASGAYLTTVGGSTGNRTGQMRHADGLTVDSTGNLYIAEYLNHRIQKFAPGVPGWLQANINGFGEQANRINSLAPLGGQLYAGTFNFGGNGAQLWRTNDGAFWTPVITNGFGITRNVGIDHLIEFGGNFYAGTWADEVNGGEVWRSSDGVNWTQVASQGFGDPTNGEVFRFAVFSDTLYASTWSYTTTHGTEIWRSSTGNAGTGNMGDWTQVVGNGLGDASNRAVLSFEPFNGYLYAGTYNWVSSQMGSNGGQVWRTGDGLNWTRVITGGLGDTNNYAVGALAAFQGYLYAGVGNWNPTTNTSAGGQIWRCSTASGCDEPGDWDQVTGNGFGSVNNTIITSLIVFDGRLYAITTNSQTGMEVWHTADGTTWEQVGFAGFGDSNNAAPYWDSAATGFNNRLFIGTTNGANGGEVWLFLHRRLYLPLVLRN